MTGAGLYLHIPFCIRKCSYCAFNSYPYERALAERFVRSVASERPPYGLKAGVETLYIGGGTPTVLESSLLSYAVKVLSGAFGLPENAEITVEANPCTLSGYDLAPLIDAGVNRISLGAQSFDKDELGLLGRLHSPEDIESSVVALRSFGIDNLGLDLIFGLPGQDMASWSRSLARAVGLGPEHISVYCLSIEEGTPLFRDAASGRLEPAAEGLQADMYELAVDVLEGAGYERYEISNFAKEGRECRHNLNYWRAGDFVGIGPGAHSSIGRLRTANIAGVDEYLCALEAGREPAEHAELVSEEEAEKEYIMLSLRTREGLSFDGYRSRFGGEFMALYAARLAPLSDAGFLISGRDGVSLTGKGMMSSNAVISELF